MVLYKKFLNLKKRFLSSVALLPVLALAFTGALSAYLGGARLTPAVARLVVGGALAMAVTYGIGQLVGAAGI